MERYNIVSRQDAIDLGAEIPTSNHTEVFVVEQDEEGLIRWFDCTNDQLLGELNSLSDELDRVAAERDQLEWLQEIYDQMDRGSRKRSNSCFDDEWD